MIKRVAQMKKIKLYIAKEGDNISIIADRFSTTEDEILRYNPSLKFKRIYKGQPLNVPLVETEEIKHESLTLRKKEEPVEEVKDNGSLVKYNYALRDALMMKAFYKKGFKYFYNEIEDAIEEWKKNNTSKFSKKLANFLIRLADGLSNFAESLFNKDIVAIKENIYKLKSEGIKTFDENTSSSYRTIIDSLMEIWRDLVIAIAELDFNKISQKFKEAIRTLDNALELRE